MIREQKSTPSYQIDTELGPMYCGITDKDHAYLGFGGSCKIDYKEIPAVTVNRVEIHASLHVGNYGDGWEFYRDKEDFQRGVRGNLYHALYTGRTDHSMREVSGSSRRKVADVMLAGFKAWLEGHPKAVADARRIAINNRWVELQEDIDKKSKELDELKQAQHLAAKELLEMGRTKAIA